MKNVDNVNGSAISSELNRKVEVYMKIRSVLYKNTPFIATLWIYVHTKV